MQKKIPHFCKTALQMITYRELLIGSNSKTQANSYFSWWQDVNENLTRKPYGEEDYSILSKLYAFYRIHSETQGMPVIIAKTNICSAEPTSKTYICYLHCQGESVFIPYLHVLSNKNSDSGVFPSQISNLTVHTVPWGSFINDVRRFLTIIDPPTPPIVRSLPYKRPIFWVILDPPTPPKIGHH